MTNKQAMHELKQDLTGRVGNILPAFYDEERSAIIDAVACELYFATHSLFRELSQKEVAEKVNLVLFAERICRGIESGHDNFESAWKFYLNHQDEFAEKFLKEDAM